MLHSSFSVLEEAIRGAWWVWTSDPVDRVVGVAALEALPGRWIDVVGYECLLPDGALAAVSVSDEHQDIAFCDLATVSDDELPSGYRQLIAQLST
jgi:hypothetical protein